MRSIAAAEGKRQTVRWAAGQLQRLVSFLSCSATAYEQGGVVAPRDSDSGGSPTLGFANHLADAFVIEERWNACRANVDADAASNDHRFGMIDVKVLAADEMDRKRAKRTTPLIGLQRFVEMFGGHA